MIWLFLIESLFLEFKHIVLEIMIYDYEIIISPKGVPCLQLHFEKHQGLKFWLIKNISDVENR